MFVQSTMVTTLLLGLGFLAHLSSAASSSSSSVRSLFTVTPRQTISYPPLDIAGPEPRTKWVEAYQRAKKAGLIPSIPKSTTEDYIPVYPPSHNGTICNAVNKCKLANVVQSAPPGMAGISFDDGPQLPSLVLLDYLKSQSQKATHFLIGSRILSNKAVFHALDVAGEHLAGHTFSHPMMTSLTDYQILGELGWVMQLIHDFSQKKLIIAQWRPPYGDVDPRVEAIARHVFGLDTILWHNDPRDWCLADSVPQGSACSIGNGPQSSSDLRKELSVFVHSAKQDGLMMLQHELNYRAIDGFKFAFPLIKKLKWIPKTIPDLFNKPWYQ